MYWISVSALCAIVYFYALGKKKRVNPPAADAEKETVLNRAEPEPDITDLDQLLEAMAGVSDPVARHELYSGQIDRAYKQRHTDPAMKKMFVTCAENYVKEFPEAKEALFESLGDMPKIVPVFRQLAIFYEENQAYDQAVALCRQALSLGVEDGTKTGFNGRIARIRKKQSA